MLLLLFGGACYLQEFCVSFCIIRRMFVLEIWGMNWGSHKLSEFYHIHLSVFYLPFLIFFCPCSQAAGSYDEMQEVKSTYQTAKPRSGTL